MKKLFEVSVERVFVVAAESQREAESEVWHYENEVVRDTDPDSIFVREILTLKDMPYGWGHCLPYGDDDVRYCEDYFKDPETGEELPTPYDGPTLPLEEK
jgi:hypothetical protein